VLCRTERPWSSSDKPAAQHALAADSVLFGSLVSFAPLNERPGPTLEPAPSFCP
jgi:hypothetical protein